MTSSLNIEIRERHEPKSVPALMTRHGPLISETDPRHIIEPGETRFKLSLRQRKSSGRCRSTSPAGHPRFTEIRQKKLPELTTLPYNDPPYDSTKFGNMAHCRDWVYRPLRFTPQSGIHWQLNLRDVPNNTQQFNSSPSTAYNRAPVDTAVDAYQSKRFPGCEGSSVSMWRHLYKPGEARANLSWETTLRGLSDNQMETSPSWTRKMPRPRDSMIESDPKLNYMYSH